MAKTTSGPKIGHNSVHGLWQPPEATSSAPGKDSPQVQGKTFSFLNAPHTQGSGSGAYMVIPNQAPNPSPILKEDSSATQSGNFLAATRRPFEDTNHLALQEEITLTGTKRVDHLKKNLLSIHPTAKDFHDLWKRACDAASKCIAEAKEYKKQRYEKKNMEPDFKAGDKVLVYTLSFNNLKGQKNEGLIFWTFHYHQTDSEKCSGG
ncbi:hypothetical protein O181_010158 [Austropuccinia psidii MF-1]|uniref:Uncharacterized protein n=1 Tax=Austropuccinia psidii MF-1 TaxID=1389203 RepID=A0A9Q3BSS6_9BASI|nr:hypothetical protein [Austropuccinia psidii MF-1]